MTRRNLIAIIVAIFGTAILVTTGIVLTNGSTPTSAPTASASQPASKPIKDVTVSSGLILHLSGCSRVEPAARATNVYVNETCEEGKNAQAWPDIVVYEPRAPQNSMQCRHDPNLTEETQLISRGTQIVGGVTADYAEAYPCGSDTSEMLLHWSVNRSGSAVSIEATKLRGLDPSGFIRAATWSGS